MGSGWLGGLAGALRGLDEGVDYNLRRARQQQDEDREFLKFWAQSGDPETQKLALAGLADMHHKSGGWKAVFGQPASHPSVTKLRQLLAAQAGPPPAPGMPEAGSAAPPPGSAVAPLSFAPTTGGSPGPVEIGQAGPGELAFRGPSSASSEDLPLPPQISGPPPSAALPSASPTAATGSSAGVSHPPGPQAAGTPSSLDEELSQIPRHLEALGVGKPQAMEDPKAIRAKVASEFGYSPEELEKANFAYTNHLRDPHKERLQTEYRTRLREATTLALSEHKGDTSAYEAAVRQLAGQTYTTHRAEASQTAAEKRYEASEVARERRFGAAEAGREHRAETASDRQMERQARAQMERTIAGAQKTAEADLPRDPLQRRMFLKQNPTLVADRKAEIVAEARAEYQRSLGRTSHEVGEDAGGGPPAAPTTAAASSGPPAAPSFAIAGPPPAPVTAEDEQRAAQLLAQLKRRGASNLDGLNPEDQRFLRDYMARKKAALRPRG
jgi:hypothetical protein